MVPALPTGTIPLVALGMIALGLALVMRRSVPKAYGMGMVMMAVFLLDTAAPLFGSASGIQAQLGFRPDTARWWTPITSAFVHAAPAGGRSIFNIHLIANLFILLTAGPALEARVGERKFLIIFFVAHGAALLSHVLLAAFTPLVGFNSLAIGASGGIFGVLTAFAVRYPREKLPLLLVFFIFWMQASVVLLVYLGFNVVYFVSDFLSGSTAGIGWWGHFAGFFVGLAFAKSLPAGPVAEGMGGTLPDSEALRPLATTPELKRLLEKVDQFSPDARTAHDSTFALTWVDKFLAKAACPEGHTFARDGLTARCANGETRIDFAKRREPQKK